MSTIQQIQFPTQTKPQQVRVAAYARVSRDTENLERSLQNQITYYSHYIRSNPDWEYGGVYVDNGISGTKIEGRVQFQQLLKDCEDGKVDIILTKSISRFARNTLDLLNTTRRLKELGVEVRFEKEHINTLSSHGELMLAVLGTFAQSESESISENLRWSVRKKYEQGISLHHRVYGYKWTGSELVVDREPAKVVRKIFRDYLKGKSMRKISDDLNNRGIDHFGKPFNGVAIHTILHNERYIGDTLLQKTICVNVLEHKRKKNTGELPMHYIKNTHKAIIKRETFEAVQKEISRRKALGPFIMSKVTRRCFTGKIICEKCGKNYIRSYKTPTNANWRCASNRKHGADGCRSIGINEEQLKKLSAFVMKQDGFDEEAFEKEIDHITASGDGVFTFYFSDGRTITQFWDSRSRAYHDAINNRKTNKISKEFPHA